MFEFLYQQVALAADELACEHASALQESVEVGLVHDSDDRLVDDEVQGCEGFESWVLSLEEEASAAPLRTVESYGLYECLSLSEGAGEVVADGWYGGVASVDMFGKFLADAPPGRALVEVPLLSGDLK